MLQKLKVYSLAQNKRWHFAVILYNGQAVMSVCFCYVLHVRHLVGLKNEHEKQYFVGVKVSNLQEDTFCLRLLLFYI